MKFPTNNVSKFYPIAKQFTNMAMNENFEITWDHLLSNPVNLDYKLNEYGNSMHLQLKKGYTKYLNDENICEDNLITAPGSDSLLRIILLALKPENVLILEPDFFRYEEEIKLQNIKLFKHQIDLNEMFINQAKYESSLLNEIKNKIISQKIKMVILSNPNNPTGIAFTQEQIKNFIAEISLDVIVIIDEAYYEFCGEQVVSLINTNPNLLVMRTLSKAWGLANLRVGFLIGNQEIIDFMQPIQGYFVLNDPTSAFAAKALESQDKMEKSTNILKKSREKLIKVLNKSSLFDGVINSSGSFLYCKVNNIKQLKSILEQAKIVIAIYENNCVRISITSEKDVDYLIETLENIK